jgi:hypothetical protein
MGNKRNARKSKQQTVASRGPSKRAIKPTSKILNHAGATDSDIEDASSASDKSSDTLIIQNARSEFETFNIDTYEERDDDDDDDEEAVRISTKTKKRGRKPKESPYCE